MSLRISTRQAFDQDFRELSGEQGLKKIAELLKGIRIAMVNTAARDGSISARPMAIQEKTFDGKLWFLTRVRSEKVDEVLEDQHVTLTLTDTSDAKYLTLKGRASVTQDRAKIRELWSSMYRAWFPVGESDPEIAVLRVDVTEAEYWQASSSSLVRSAKYLAAAITGNKSKTSVGEAGRVLLGLAG
jgi:general stress protein 26